MCQIFKSELHCEENLFFCGVGTQKYHKCIPERWTCDGIADCPNSSDEGLLCHKGKGKIGTELGYYLARIFMTYLYFSHK